MDNIKVVHVGEDYGTIAVNGDEFECSLALALAVKKEIAYQKKNMTWSCERCGKGKVVVDYDTLAVGGTPSCPVCGSEHMSN